MQAMRLQGVEPGEQAWEACMLPLHYRRPYWLWARDNVCVQACLSGPSALTPSTLYLSVHAVPFTPSTLYFFTPLFSLVSKGYGSGFQTPAT